MCAIGQLGPEKGRVGRTLNLPVSTDEIEIMFNYTRGGGVL